MTEPDEVQVPDPDEPEVFTQFGDPMADNGGGGK